MKFIFALSLSLFVMSCAEAGKEGADARPSGPDAAVNIVDGGGGGFPDAGTFPDARTFPDAAPPADAGLPTGDGGILPGMCETTADCTNAGECCLIGICIPGQEVIPGFCLPI